MCNNTAGGMQAAGVIGSIPCPKCGKCAAVKKTVGNIIAYMHYTKTGALWHVQNQRTGDWETRKWEDVPHE